MDLVESFRALNDQLREGLRGVLSDLSDEQLRQNAPEIDERSIAEVAEHAYSGVALFAAVVARGTSEGLPMEQPKVPDTAHGMLEYLDEMHDSIDALLAEVTEEKLSAEVTMPWGEVIRGLQAMTGAFAHGFQHVGCMGGMRAVRGFPTPPEPY